MCWALISKSCETLLLWFGLQTEFNLRLFLLKTSLTNLYLACTRIKKYAEDSSFSPTHDRLKWTEEVKQVADNEKSIARKGNRCWIIDLAEDTDGQCYCVAKQRFWRGINTSRKSMERFTHKVTLSQTRIRGRETNHETSW